MHDTYRSAPTTALARPDHQRLFEVASEQAGYFTTEQARGCGFSRALLSHHVKSGRFERYLHGLYRIVRYPSSMREDVMVAWLAVGKDIAVVSHDSALELLNLSDIIPFKIHLTVPRRNRATPKLAGVKIHTVVKPIPRIELTYRDGMVLTNATRSILDTAEDGLSPDQVELAVSQAIERGIVRPEQLRKQAQSRNRRVAAMINDALRDSV